MFFAVLLYGSESAESVSVFGIAFTDKNDIIDFGKADPKAPTKNLHDALSLSLYQQNGKKRIGTEEMNEIKNTKSDFEQKIDNLKQMLQSSRRVVFLGGAVFQQKAAFRIFAVKTEFLKPFSNSVTLPKSCFRIHFSYASPMFSSDIIKRFF